MPKKRARVLVEECLSLDVNLLHREGALVGDDSHHCRAASLVINGTQTVKLAWTNCHFGNKRPWFRCPQCDRRCAKLINHVRFRWYSGRQTPAPGTRVGGTARRVARQFRSCSRLILTAGVELFLGAMVGCCCQFRDTYDVTGRFLLLASIKHYPQTVNDATGVLFVRIVERIRSR